jgi:hypothetical protein
MDVSIKSPLEKEKSDCCVVCMELKTNQTKCDDQASSMKILLTVLKTVSRLWEQITDITVLQGWHS